MRASAWLLAAGLGLVFSLGSLSAAEEKQESCGDYGTSVNFMATPQDAAKWAKKQEKLVFILHVSGEFENSGLT